MTRLRPLLGRLGLVLVLGGCVRASAVQAELRQGTTRGGQVEGVPFVPQRPDTCGAAALASVLLHAGLAADEGTLAEDLRTRPGQGALTYELALAARRAGALAAQRYGVSAEDLRRSIDAGVAPIVLRGGFAHALLGVYHYSVLTAYDLNRRLWIGHDGVEADVLFSFDDLEADRARADGWVLFVVGPAGRSVGLPADVHLELGVQAEERGLAEVARHHYGRAAWAPTSAQALLNLGNVAQAAGELAQAEVLLRAALVADPGSAAVRNNLAWVLYRLGRDLEEGERLARAAAEDPQVRPHALDTLERLRAARGSAPAGPPGP